MSQGKDTLMKYPDIIKGKGVLGILEVFNEPGKSPLRHDIY